MRLMTQAPRLLELCKTMFAGLENGLTADEYFKIKELYREVVQYGND